MYFSVNDSTNDRGDCSEFALVSAPHCSVMRM